jgi:hypothetical protein
MRREYRFDYRKSRPNRFASLMKGGTVAGGVGPGRCLRIPISGVGKFLAAISNNRTPQANQGTVEVWLTNRCKGLGLSYGFENIEAFFKGPRP